MTSLQCSFSRAQALASTAKYLLHPFQNNYHFDFCKCISFVININIYLEIVKNASGSPSSPDRCSLAQSSVPHEIDLRRGRAYNGAGASGKAWERERPSSFRERTARDNGGYF
jgi:hypothetical protein